jgi:hypothetical protein
MGFVRHKIALETKVPHWVFMRGIHAFRNNPKFETSCEDRTNFNTENPSDRCAFLSLPSS